MHDESAFSIDSPVRTMQIICGSLIGGVVMFLGIAVFLRTQGGVGGGLPQPILSFVALLFSCATVAASLFVPNLTINTARRQIARGTWQPAPRTPAGLVPATDEGKLLTVYQTAMLIRAALYEGTAFFWIIVYLVEGNTWALLGAGLFLAGVALQFPSRDGVEQWLMAQLQQLEEDRRTAEA